MYESYVTVAGNLTAEPTLRHTKDGRPFATFRIASTVRRWDGRAGRYVDGGTNFVSVAAFNALAANVVASCHKGQPVVVYGRLRVNTWTPAEGRATSSVEIDAYHVGHDLSWGQASFTKVARVQFDSSDRLAGPEIQQSLAELEGEPPVDPEELGLPDPQDLDDAEPAEVYPLDAGAGRAGGGFDLAQADAETDDYVVAQAG